MAERVEYLIDRTGPLNGLGEIAVGLGDFSEAKSRYANAIELTTQHRLAKYEGVSRSNLPLVLPNIGNFYDATGSPPPIGFLL